MKSYLKSFFGCLLIFIIFWALLAFYPFLAGEYKNLGEIASKQLSSKNIVLYETALHSIHHDYKNFMFRKLHPEVVVIGSSRVMEFGQYMFSKSFYNLGSVMNNLEELQNYKSSLIEKTPQLVLIGVDPWWFNQKIYVGPNAITHTTKLTGIKEDNHPIFSPSDASTILNWLIEGKISLSGYYNGLFTDNENIGLFGKMGIGFGVDGRRYDRTMATKKDINYFDAKGFRDTMTRVNTGRFPFVHSFFSYDIKIEEFIEFIDTLSSKGISTILFFPPLAPEIYARVQELSNEYNYIKDLKEKFKNKGLVLHDFLDPSLIDSGSCEFIDGTHGGEITLMRLLTELVKREPLLIDYINLENLLTLVNENEGLAFIPDARVTDKKEVDFLLMNCVK